MVYDIYIYEPPNDPKSVYPLFQKRGLSLDAKDYNLYGYLGLNLDFVEVTATLFLLYKQGVRGILVPIMYRDTVLKVGKEAAYLIAEHDLREKARKQYPAKVFSAPVLIKKYPMWYLFGTKSERLTEVGNSMGKAPFAMFHCYVDVIDGHLWSREEREKFFEPLETRLSRLHSGQDKP